MNTLLKETRLSRSRETKGDKVFQFIVGLLMFLTLIIVLYPLIYILSASVSNPYAVSRGKMWLWPVGFTFEGYKLLFTYQDIWTGYGNTILYTVLGTLLALAVTLPAAYAMSRPEFVGRGALMVMVMITMFFSGGLVPTYLNIRKLGLLNTRTLMIICGASSAYNLLVSRSFFSALPNDLVEAARIDGAGNFRIFYQMVLPLSKPIIAVMAMYFAVSHWNDYMTALIYLQDRKLFNLQVILREILTQNELAASMATDVDALAYAEERARLSQMIKYSSIIVSALPLLIAYPFLQRFFIKGVMIGAVKG